jgi:hypothetical protein
VRKKLQAILSEYGPIALVVYLTLFFLVLFTAWAAIHMGWRPESVAANVGSFTAAYLATKLTQGFRIAATLALTPVVARTYGRVSARFTGGRAG